MANPITAFTQEEFTWKVAKGETIYRHTYKFGGNESVGGNEEVLWDGGGSYGGFIVEADIGPVSIVSSNANDVNGGSGAWEIEISGLGPEKMPQVRRYLLNGTTPVITGETWFRVFRMKIVTSGGSLPEADSNTGTVTATLTTGSTPVMAQINPGEGQTQMLIYTIAANSSALLLNADANVGKGKEVRVRVRVRSGDDVNAAWRNVAYRDIFQNSFVRVYKSPRPVGPLTDICMTGENLGSGNVECTASFELLEYNTVDV